MRSNLFTAALLLFTSTPSFAAPQPITDVQLISRDDAAVLDARDAIPFGDASDLWKRKGGGGGGGKGGGGGSSGSSGSSGSGSSGKGGSSGSSSGSTSGGKGSSSSSAGGSTKQGSGVQPSYGGGKYYGGGAATPYSSGGRSPLGIAPVFLGVGALTLFPGIWLYGAYAYPYHNPYTFHNRTGHRNNTSTKRGVEIRQDDTTGVNQTKPVQCLCAAYAECGCDDNGNTTFLDSLIGDGTYSKLNHSLVQVVDFPNGTSIIAINGTLPNGTTTAGGSEDANGSSSAVRTMVESSGYWVMIALVGFTVFLV